MSDDWSMWVAARNAEIGEILGYLDRRQDELRAAETTARQSHERAAAQESEYRRDGTEVGSTPVADEAEVEQNRTQTWRGGSLGI